LALGSLDGRLMCSLLWRTHANQLANRWLAALLAMVVLMITPYTIGYAGFYDAYPWLTFSPFYWQSGIGPLIWLYVRQLGSERRPPGWQWHFAPLCLQVGYYDVLFCLPLEAKWRWNDTVQQPFVAPAERASTALSIATYLRAAYRRYQGYQRRQHRRQAPIRAARNATGPSGASACDSSWSPDNGGANPRSNCPNSRGASAPTRTTCRAHSTRGWA
jgi:hypothetical protein